MIISSRRSLAFNLVNFFIAVGSLFPNISTSICDHQDTNYGSKSEGGCTQVDVDGYRTEALNECNGQAIAGKVKMKYCVYQCMTVLQTQKIDL